LDTLNVNENDKKRWITLEDVRESAQKPGRTIPSVETRPKKQKQKQNFAEQDEPID